MRGLLGPLFTIQFRCVADSLQAVSSDEWSGGGKQGRVDIAEDFGGLPFCPGDQILKPDRSEWTRVQAPFRNFNQLFALIQEVPRRQLWILQQIRGAHSRRAGSNCAIG